MLLAGRRVRYRKNVKRGDIVRFTFDHTGLFVKWIDKSRTTFETIEGNTGRQGASSDSGESGVFRRVRHVSQVNDFRRVRA